MIIYICFSITLLLSVLAILKARDMDKENSYLNIVPIIMLSVFGVVFGLISIVTLASKLLTGLLS